MPRKNQEYCPTCASPNTFVVGEKSNGPHREVKRECVCGETWWSPAPSPTPALEKLQAESYSARASSIDQWTAQLEQNMRDLQNDPDRLYELTKRGF